MKTKNFIDFLATGAGPAPKFNAALKLFAALLAGLAASLGIGCVVHGITPSALSASARWVRVAYALSMLAVGWVMVQQLARPLLNAKGARWPLMLMVLVMAGFGVAAWMASSPGQTDVLFWGESWMVSPFLIVLYSLPGLAAALWALRTLAPTRLRFAGFAAGIFAGAQGVLGYVLIGPDDAYLFVAMWYTLGVLLTGFIGMLLGSKVLRW
ncbi:NrsF family protein [Achromobacter kerstersii]|uniref:NrsF family protein n=1 Tax=Achromobacter kerstersii TaxID=1353890 RepID=UPI003D03D909